METIVKQFNELTVGELYEILKLRVEVFVVEQTCAYQDLDDIDQEAYHVYLRNEEGIVAYLRVIDKDKRLDEVSIGRVISLRFSQFSNAPSPILITVEGISITSRFVQPLKASALMPRIPSRR